MLRLVFLPWLAPPADQQQHGDLVDLGVHQAEQRVYRVAKAGVLQVDERELAGRHVVPCGDRHCSAFIGGDYVLVHWVVIGHVPAEVFEQGIWNACEKTEPALIQLLVKDVWGKEITLSL